MTGLPRAAVTEITWHGGRAGRTALRHLRPQSARSSLWLPAPLPEYTHPFRRDPGGSLDERAWPAIATDGVSKGGRGEESP